MHIDLWGLALQAINFAVLAWLLQRFLYHPIARVVTQRRALVETDLAAAKEARNAAEENRRAYEHGIAEIAAERERMMADARAHIESERRQVIESAEAQAAVVMATQRRQCEEERRLAAEELGDQAVALALALSQKLLGQVSGEVVTTALLERICGQLATEPPERLREREPVLQVATMPGLGLAEQNQWRSRLATFVGEAVEILFVTDESLIAGAELRFPSLVVSLSWRDCLADAQAALMPGAGAGGVGSAGPKATDGATP
jgi:F-type H+-transporting ATPase subunit b